MIGRRTTSVSILACKRLNLSFPLGIRDKLERGCWYVELVEVLQLSISTDGRGHWRWTRRRRAQRLVPKIHNFSKKSLKMWTRKTLGGQIGNIQGRFDRSNNDVSELGNLLTYEMMRNVYVLLFYMIDGI